MTNRKKTTPEPEDSSKKAASPPAEETPVISIRRIDAGRILVPIRGTAPLITHNWSAKAKLQMLLAMQGTKLPAEVKNPQVEYEAAFYQLDTVDEAGNSRYGVPVLSFKAATVSAARFYGKSVSMVALRQFLFFRGEYSKSAKQQLIEIFGEPEMREDPVTVGRGGRDLRYRPEFWPWSATLDIAFAKNSIDKESVLSLVDAGGMGVGVGEWRPERNGVSGTYEIDQDREIEVIDG